MNCRYCNLPVEEKDKTITHSYWQGVPFICHKSCKVEGEKEEAYLCQNIDADCNDCKYFKRGTLVKKELSDIIDGKPGKRLVNMGYFEGHCLKFDKPAIACPKQCTGLKCFEHRKD